jgi:hypothetical protein
VKLKINRNQVLIGIGLIAFCGPDLDAVARWLLASHIPHVTGLVHLLGWASTAVGGLALAWPRIRGFLALLGMATPPGAQAPWIPGKDDVVPFPAPQAVQQSSVLDVTGTYPVVPSPDRTEAVTRDILPPRPPVGGAK